MQLAGMNALVPDDLLLFFDRKGVCLTDEDKIEEEKLDLYFRHENSAIIISGNFDEEDEIIVQSLDGKIVLNQNAQEEIFIDTDVLSTGIFIVSYFRKNERILTKKIQIVR